MNTIKEPLLQVQAEGGQKIELTTYLNKVKEGLNIVCMCFGEMGHAIPMMRFIEALEEAGHSVTLLS